MEPLQDGTSFTDENARGQMFDHNSGSGNPSASEESLDNPNIAYSGACSVFNGVQIPMTIPSSAQDVVLKGHAGALNIDLA